MIQTKLFPKGKGAIDLEADAHIGAKVANASRGFGEHTVVVQPGGIADEHLEDMSTGIHV